MIFFEIFNRKRFVFVILAMIIMLGCIVMEYHVTWQFFNLISSAKGLDMPFMRNVAGLFNAFGVIINWLLLSYIYHIVSDAFLDSSVKKGVDKIMIGVSLGFLLIIANDFVTLHQYQSHSQEIIVFFKSNPVDNVSDFALYKEILARNIIAFILLILWGSFVTKKVKRLSSKEFIILFIIVSLSFFLFRFLLPVVSKGSI